MQAVPSLAGRQAVRTRVVHWGRHVLYVSLLMCKAVYFSNNDNGEQFCLSGVKSIFTLLENGLLVPVTGRISAGPCGRH